ncbi:uncharacterized protein LOC118196282 [Stegodyphus dumicola]|uniref:uncharacterized protein LOC118196282 n=1 Tax=Stegodyphus dumicola TaxID=202533 RepID=UPI0015ADF622|nr:uncharacterized protein LOC118196282 [Stegodyphus dumicola]
MANDKRNNDMCLCALCSCGEHRCPEQEEKLLPRSLQKIEDSDAEKLQKIQEKKARICHAYNKLPASELYKETTYKRDFCDQPLVPELQCIETERKTDNLKTESGCMEDRSIYSTNFVPWMSDSTALRRMKLRNSGDTWEDLAKPSKEDTQRKLDRLHMYYCPELCAEERESSFKRNCLIPHKEIFNLGPPITEIKHQSEKTKQPLSKFTSYWLDYIPHAVLPRQSLRKEGNHSFSEQPMSSETTHRKEFVWHPEIRQQLGRKKEDQPSNIKMGGDGPMETQSSSMMDYKDPDVGRRMPFKVERPVFKRPQTRMETETSTGASYPRWRVLPIQVKPKKLPTTYQTSPSKDIRNLVTTYQEDFNGLRAALCPARIVASYGRIPSDARQRWTTSSDCRI